MVGAVLFAFLLGLSVGILIGRRSAPRRGEEVPVAVVTPTIVARGEVKPSKRGRKAGLTEADFTPSDDILERLRKAAEGELDPSEIEAPPATTTAAEDAAEAARRAELAEKERRVLERLKQLEAEDEDDGSRG